MPSPLFRNKFAFIHLASSTPELVIQHIHRDHWYVEIITQLWCTQHYTGTFTSTKWLTYFFWCFGLCCSHRTLLSIDINSYTELSVTCILHQTSRGLIVVMIWHLIMYKWRRYTCKSISIKLSTKIVKITMNQITHILHAYVAKVRKDFDGS